MTAKTAVRPVLLRCQNAGHAVRAFAGCVVVCVQGRSRERARLAVHSVLSVIRHAVMRSVECAMILGATGQRDAMMSVRNDLMGFTVETVGWGYSYVTMAVIDVTVEAVVKWVVVTKAVDVA